MRKAVVGAATFAAFRQSSSPVLAEDIMDTPGRIVQIEIANLEGVEGNTGIVKLKLQPDWAPRGVKRFEVCRMFLFKMSSILITFLPS
jgi:hypothetical protein